MEKAQVTCKSSDEEVVVVVLRKEGRGFANEVEWTASDGSAKIGENYGLNKGMQLRTIF